MYQMYYIFMIYTIDYENDFINEPITMKEVQYAIEKLKSGKAAGVDMISNAILKLSHFLEPVCAFLKTCFNIGFAPTLWVKSIINPIPKNMSKCILFTYFKLQGDKPPVYNIEYIIDYFTLSVRIK